MVPIDPVTGLAFSIHSQPGLHAILLGSGVSRSAGIPTGWEMALELLRRLAAAEGVLADVGNDLEGWYRSTHGEEAGFSSLLRQLAGTRGDRRALLAQFIEPGTGGNLSSGRPTQAHRSLASLARAGFIRVFLTTNFDRLLEQALADEGIQPRVLASAADARGAEPLHHMGVTVIKAHGDYQSPDDMRVTEEELVRYDPEVEGLLDEVFEEYAVVVCGWSGDWDPGLQNAMRRRRSRRYPVYWAYRSEPQGVARDLMAALSAVPISIADADSFFSVLHRKVAGLVEVTASHPLDVDLAVAELKRLLPRSEDAIRVNDLVLAEARRARQLLFDVDRFPVAAQSRDGLTEDELRSRVRRQEALVEILARMFGVLGRWASRDDLLELSGAALKCLGDAETLSGTTILISLRRYPGMVCMYAGGVAAVAADNWEALAAMTYVEIPMPLGERAPAIAGLCPFRVLYGDPWEGRWLSDVPGDYVPMSRHMESLTKAHLGGLVDKNGFEDAFDRFEYLVGVLFMDHRIQSQGLLQSPVGFFHWRHQYEPGRHPEAWLRRQLGILDEGDEAAGGWEGLAAGLFGGDPTRAATALRTYREKCLDQAPS